MFTKNSWFEGEALHSFQISESWTKKATADPELGSHLLWTREKTRYPKQRTKTHSLFKYL